MTDPVFGNPVRQAYIRPPGSAMLTGNFRVTQDFGPTSFTGEPPLTWTDGEGITPAYYPHFHKGLDLGNGLCGSDVLAAQAGKVTAAGWYEYTSGGKVYRVIRVILDHGSGWTTAYFHLQDETVSVGQTVAKGALIGHVGTTGQSTACHLHVTLREGTQYLDLWRRLEQNQEAELIPITDATHKLVTTKAGAVYYDPATDAVVSKAVATNTRTSYYASGIYRTVTITRSTGVTQLVGVKSSGDPAVSIAPVPVPPAPKVLAAGVYEVKA